MFRLQASGAAAAACVVGRMGTDAHVYDDPNDAAVPALLDSRFDADKVDALKHLLTVIGHGVYSSSRSQILATPTTSTTNNLWIQR